MAEEPFYSSQGSHYDQHQIPLDQENLASSPPGSRSPHISLLKPRKPPTVTPKRFNKFFTPRASLTRGGRRSAAGRQLRDITKNAANRRRLVEDDLLQHVEHESSARPTKRRRISLDVGSSPPQSSPLKHVQTAEPIRVFEDEPVSPSLSAIDALSDLLEDSRPFPQPISRLRKGAASRRVLERSFGGYGALSRGKNGTDHCGDWRSETANFVSTPDDVHSFRPGTAVPFCTASCNTNSLVAIGDEEGSIRLVDTSENFAATHVSFRAHKNALMDLAFSSDDFTLATASGDQSSRIVDMHTQQVLCILSGHKSSVKQVRFQPGNDHVVTTSSRDGTVQIWDLRCAERGSVKNLRLGQRRFLNEDGVPEPSVRFARDSLKVGPAHRSVKGTGIRSPSTQNSEDSSVSVTAIEHLPGSRSHLLVSGSELNASVKLWDLRNAGRREPVPLGSTPLPETHRLTRNWGISSLAVSGDGARLYSLCKDATVYAYSTNHLVMGQAPELSSESSRRRTLREPTRALGPLYAFKHAALNNNTFYVKLALRPAKDDKSELLAVGNTNGAPVLFPTDERHLARQRPHPADDEGTSDHEGDLPTLNLSRSASEMKTLDTLPTYQQGTSLVRGHKHDCEVTALTWGYDGSLVTISDDFTARCWRGDADKAREMRGCGEGEGLRWDHGWAEVSDWDDENSP